MNNKLPDIHYTFEDNSLLERALSHPSITNYALDNQRFEFLGDSLLSWCVSEWLFENHPQVNEGDLNEMKVSVVSGKSLTQKAIELELDKYLKMSDSHSKHFGTATDSMLENCLEALVAAIYLDSNFEKAKEWIVRTFNAELTTALNEAQSQNPKGQLQEWTQLKHAGIVPNYKLIKSEGPGHEKRFTVHVYLSNKALGKGTASSIKGAEINAAKDALSQIQI